MPSPFPGMNPFLEQDDVWRDFHGRFLPAAAEMIGAQVQPDYVVKIDEHVYVHELPPGPRRLIGRADLGVALARPAAEQPAGLGLLEAPARVRLPEVDVQRGSFIEVRDRRSREVVCVVELLSPSNKRPGPDRGRYLSKRREVLNGPAHLVEIDLLRAEEAMPSEGRPRCDYSVMVSRAADRPDAGLWAVGLREPLPVVPVRPPRADARLDLQALIHKIYDASGYAYYVYEGTPALGLAPEDVAWARGLLGPPIP